MVVLSMSVRTTRETLTKEIIYVRVNASPDHGEPENVYRVNAIDERYRSRAGGGLPVKGEKARN